MTDLIARAIVQAVDNFSGPMARMAASAAKFHDRVRRDMVHASHLTNSATLGLGSRALGLGAAMHSFWSKEYDWDRLIHQYKAISEVSEETFASMTARITEVSDKFGVSRIELLGAAKAWVEIGGKADAVIPILERVTETSKIMGVSIAEALTESRALLIAFGQDANNADNVLDMENFFLVASKSIKGGGHALLEAMKNAAPVAGALHLPKEETAAMLSTIIDANFQPGEAGRAVKTGIMRLAAPTKDQISEMRAAGVDVSKLFNFDFAKIKNGGALAEAMRGAGLPINGNVMSAINGVLGGLEGGGGIYQAQDALQEKLASLLGIKKGDARNRQILQKIIQQHMQRAVKGINTDELFKLQSQPLSFFTRVFGKEHGAKWLELLRNEAKYRERLNKIVSEKDGAIQRKSKIFFEGFAFEWDRLKVSIENFMGAVGSSGIRGDLASVFRSMSSGFNALQKMDPDVLKMGVYGAAGLSAAPLIAWLLKNPLAKVLAGGGIASLIFGADFGKLFDSPDRLDARGPLGESSTLMGPNAPMRQLLDATVGVFQETAGLANDLYREVAALFNLDTSDSLLLDGLRMLVSTLKDARGEIERMRELGLLKWLGDSNKESSGRSDWGLLDPLVNWGKGTWRGQGYRDEYNYVPASGLTPLHLLPLQVEGQAEVRVRIIPPDGWRALMEGGGAVRVPLKTGSSMPDVVAP